VEEQPKRRPGRPRTRDKLAQLRLEEPIESLPPVARNLLDGARRILERDGFTALSLSAIAEEADESKASIGYYFGNKEGLIVVLVDSLVHDANRALIAETHRYPMGEQRLRALVTGERDIIRDTPGFMALLELLPYVLRDDSLRARIAGLYAGYRQTVLDVVDATGGPDESTLRPFAALMIAVVDGLSVQYALDPEGFDVDAAIALWERMIRCLFQDLRMVDVG
jgi:AcrR family transcriptional regulator